MTQAIETQEADFAPVKDAANTIPWRYLAAAEHRAELRDATGNLVQALSYGTEFSVTPDADTAANSGTMTLLIEPPATATVLTLRGETLATSNWTPPAGQEQPGVAFDRLALVAQQLTRELANTLRVRAGGTIVEGNEGEMLTFDAAGKLIPTVGPITGITASSAGAALVDDLTFGDMLTTMEFSAFFQTLIGAANKAGLRASLDATRATIAKSANYTVATTDRGKIIRTTATLTLDALTASSAGNDFFFFVDVTAGTTTSDPAGAETIDGNPTKDFGAGTFTKIYTDGINWYSATIFDPATVADFRAATVDRVLEAKTYWDAKAEVALTDAANVTLDMATGINFALLATSGIGATREIDNPTNPKVGQRGIIAYVQDATGGRLLTLDTDYSVAGGGTTIWVDQAANAVTFIKYYVRATDDISLFVDIPSLGVGQRWTDVKTTPGRARATWYKNTTGRTIQAQVAMTSSGSNSFRVGPSKSFYVTLNFNDADSGEHKPTGVVTIPPDHYYYLNASSGSIRSWFELI